MHLVYPPKLCITIVFDFSWDDCNTLENLETMVMQNSEGENKVHYKRFERCKVCVKLSYLTDNLVPRSPSSCAGLRKWRLRDGPTRRAREGPLKLPEERKSLKRKENWRRLLLLGIQTGDTLAKPPFFVAYSRLCGHCRNLAEGGCCLSRLHFRFCRYFLGHVARRNLPWQGLSYGRRSLTRVKLQEIFHKEKSEHIYFLERMSWVQFLGYNMFTVNPFCFLKFFFILWVAWYIFNEFKDWTIVSVVCYTAVFSVVTQRNREERCVTTLKTAL